MPARLSVHRTRRKARNVIYKHSILQRRSNRIPYIPFDFRNAKRKFFGTRLQLAWTGNDSQKPFGFRELYRGGFRLHRSDRNRNKEYKKTIAHLKKENRRLKAELTRNNTGSRLCLGDCDEATRKFNAHCRSAELIHETSYLGYLKKRFTTASLYSIWTRILAYFRRFRLITTIFKVITSLITILGTSAFFLFISMGIFVLIPFLLIFFSFFLISGIFYRKKRFEELMRSASGCTIYVFFPIAGQPFEKGSFFKSTVKSILNDTDNQNFIIVVSPYFFSPKGIDEKNSPYYHILRIESERVCIIRKNSFFALRKKFLSHTDSYVIYVY